MQLSNHGDRGAQLTLLRAISRIKNECPTEYRIFRDSLDREAQSLMEELREAEGTALHRIQGHAQRLHALAVFLDDVQDLQRMTIEAIERRRNTPG